MRYNTPMPLTLMSKQVKSWQSHGYRVVLATGVFDLLHIEHLRFLTKAKAAGDKLLVGIESDARVKTIKGQNRPVNSQTIRLEQLRALRAVDLAFILPKTFNSQSDWENLMQQLHPDLYAVSSHTSFLKNKQAICRQFGIQFKIVHQQQPAHSTSLLIAKLINPHIADHHPRFTTTVILGQGKGKHLGFPTLNLKIPAAFPYQHGIYAGYVWLKTKKYLGAFHFGPIPVFNQTKANLEVHLLHRQQDIIQSQIDFQFLHYLRPIKSFPNQAELINQITQDVNVVQTLLKT